MPTIRFHNFSNGSPTKSVDLPGYALTDAIAKLAKKHCGLGSKLIDAGYYPPRKGETLSHEGYVTAGMRVVGKFTLLP